MFDRCITTETDELVNINARTARISGSTLAPKIRDTNDNASEKEIDVLAAAIFAAHCPGIHFAGTAIQQYRIAARAALGRLQENEDGS